MKCQACSYWDVDDLGVCNNCGYRNGSRTKHPSTIWRIRFCIVLACIATAAATVVICVDVVDPWRTAWALIGAVLIGVYCGMVISMGTELPEEEP